DDVNLVARTKNERLHLRVPETGLVTKVNAGLEHVAHCDVRHLISPVRVGPPCSLMTQPHELRGHPGPCDGTCVDFPWLAPSGYNAYPCGRPGRALYTTIMPAQQSARAVDCPAPLRRPPGQPDDLSGVSPSIMTVTLKTPEDIEQMREAGRL